MSKTLLHTDIAIVGAGLSGLALAEDLQRQGVTCHVFEARKRLGGRIKTERFVHEDQAITVDLGPSWFWPGQSRMQALVERLDISVFEQYAQGEQRFEDENGRVFHAQGYASMQGSYRLSGGMSALIDGLAASLPQNIISLNTAIKSLRRVEGDVLLIDGDGHTLARAKRVVLSLPPRIAATLNYEPVLPETAVQSMLAIPTWMAGQAKCVVMYRSSFWREMGLSGDAMSRRGPLAEIHDACDPRSSLGALFGFIAVPANSRAVNTEAIKSAVIQQLVRLFGEQAASPLSVIIQDWAQAVETTTPDDISSVNHGHFHYGVAEELTGLWSGCLYLGSTETAPQFGGYLEGALEAAERVSKALLDGLSI